MADSNSLLAFFSQMKALDGVVVQEQPKLDLDLYIQNYEGRTCFDRLLHIGKSSVPLCVDALKAAVIEAKQGRDVNRYREAWDCIRIAAPNEPEAVRDDAWIEKLEAENKVETARLETELKGYKNNLIKESIRMGQEDLGTHLEQIGMLKEAADSYARMRHDASTTKHIMDCSQRLVSVALQRRDWTATMTNVGKITGLQNVDEEKAMQPYIKIVTGIGQLGLNKYREAALNFLQADGSIPANTFNDIASPNDVAIFGGLLALATMDRVELQERVLDNQRFRGFLEHEPTVRKAIAQFVSGRFAACLRLLEGMRPDCLLDIYFQRHVPTIYSRIRTKCIVGYFAPFSCVTLDSLDSSFGRPDELIEDELANMIRNGALNARIDSKAKLLVAVSPDPRLEMQKSALQVARRYEQEAKERLRRINMAAAGLEVAAPKKPNTTDDAWYESERTGQMLEMPTLKG